MPDHTLSSRELVRAALAGRDVPRVPTGPLAVHFCARLAGVSIRDYTLNPRVLADCVLRYYERFRPDAIWLSADTWITAQAMGAPVAFPDADQPMGGSGVPLLREPRDLKKIPAPDAGAQGRYPLMLEATRLIRQGLGNDVFLVACFDQYPFSVACELLGIERAMTAAHEEPQFLAEVMDRAAEYAIVYALALGREGADLLSGGDSPAGLLGPKLWHEIAAPYEQRVISIIKSRSPLPVSLHICGNALPLLTGAPAPAPAPPPLPDVLELDSQVNLPHAARYVGPNVTLWGNLDPVSLLAQSTPESIRAARVRLVKSMSACGHKRFVLSSGCTLALETPAENLDAMLAP